jgi:hypothetical protein
MFRIDTLQLGQMLRRFSRARSPADTERELERVVEAVAPEVRAFFRRRFGVRGDFVERGRTPAEMAAAEAYFTVLGIVGAELRRAREGERAPIASLPAYTYRVAQQQYSRFLRQKDPLRARLRDDLRDLLDGRTAQEGFARWQAPDREWLCGFASWRETGRRLDRAAPGYQLLLSDPRALTREQPEAAESANLADLVAALLNLAGGPVELDDLVTMAAELAGLRAPQEVTVAEDAPDPLESAPDGRPSPSAQVEWRESLRRLSVAVRSLRLSQRRAFLLGGRHGALTDDLVVQGIISIRALAEVLEMDPETLASLWSEIPLKDARIAALFGNRNGQEVINQRNDARKHLAGALTPPDAPNAPNAS